GYPRGLRGDEILLEARIIHVADSMEAMMSHRPFRRQLGQAQALAQLQQYKGSVYDPAVVDACLALFDEHGYQLPDHKRKS
ncbi:HD domain-containing phosphohydrolase, partial [Aquitalea sp. ASV11]|uniref:HD domain-containing phosphohydrolase n=1 Tax=Aquitalea sp. ASV11 TaxID=2795103 RepID=UPI00351C1949